MQQHEQDLESKYDDVTEDGEQETQLEHVHSGSISSSSSCSSSSPCVWLSSFSGRVCQGTCGWTDASILKSRRFYPSSVHSAIDRLKHYSTVFPCVEVDSSNYAIPPVNRVRSWLPCTPEGFLFHFKVFGLFTMMSVRTDAIPGALREMLPDEARTASTVKYKDLPRSFITALWSYWNGCILAAHDANKLGLVIFQFHLGFTPNESNVAHVRDCRAGLDARYRMGVEFRDRRWFAEEQMQQTTDFCTELDMTLICEDDLAEETYRHVAADRPARLPIVYTATSTHSMYIRLHRRVGDERGDRVLQDYEYKEWARRLQQGKHREQQQIAVTSQSHRVVFFLWGTDCYDDPITNFRNLEKQIKLVDQSESSDLSLDWPSIVRSQQRYSERSLVSMFSKQQQKAEMESKQAKPQSTESKEEEATTTATATTASLAVQPAPSASRKDIRSPRPSTPARPLATESPAKKRKGATSTSSSTEVKNNKSITSFFSVKNK